MWAIAIKEFRQLRRDRRTLAMLVIMPLGLLIIFGYAARFDVSTIRVAVVGPNAERIASALPPMFDVVSTDSAGDRTSAEHELRDGHADAAVLLTPGAQPVVLVDGSNLFTAKATVEATSRAAANGGPLASLRTEVLYNSKLKTSAVMVPGLIGIVLVFVGTMVTALGVVRERQAGTLEQLAVMPFRPRDVFLGKILPYFAVAAVDTAVIVGAGLALFGVPFRGNPAVFVLGALLFLFVTLGIGVLISTVSANQGQAIQLAIMTLLPQVLLSGLIFPVASMAPGVRWISYLLPLTYFIEISRGVLLRAAPIATLWFPLLMLAALGATVFTLSVVRFRRDLAPARRRSVRGGTTTTATVTS